MSRYDEAYITNILKRKLNLDASKLKDEKYDILIGLGTGYFHLVPRKNRTLERCIKACFEDCNNFRLVPEEYITLEFCLNYLEKHPAAIDYIPDEFLTTEICLKALKMNINKAPFVPDEVIDEKIFEILINDDICRVYEYRTEIFQRFITHDMFEKVLLNPYNIQCIIELKNWMNEEDYNSLFTPEICVKFAKQSPIYIFNVLPKINIDETILEITCENFPEFMDSYFHSHIVDYIHNEKILFHTLLRSGEDIWSYINHNFPEYINENLYEKCIIERPGKMFNLPSFSKKFLTSRMLFKVLRLLDLDVILDFIAHLHPEYISLEIMALIIYKEVNFSTFETVVHLLPHKHRNLYRNLKKTVNDKSFLLLLNRLKLLSSEKMKELESHENFISDLQQLLTVYRCHPTHAFNEMAHTYTKDSSSYTREQDLCMHRQILSMYDDKPLSLKQALNDIKIINDVY